MNTTTTAAEAVTTCPTGIAWCTDHMYEADPDELGSHRRIVSVWANRDQVTIDQDGDDGSAVVYWGYDSAGSEDTRAFARALLAAADELDEIEARR